VELWDEMCERKFRQVDVPVQGLKTAVEIYGPLAGDIVRDLDITDFATLKIRCDYVICVDISKMI